MKTCILLLALVVVVRQGSADDVRYIGCYKDYSFTRSLRYGPFTKSSMTSRLCSLYCAKFQYFGLQNGDECFCGNAGYDRYRKLTEDRCNKPCSGDRKQRCGSGFVNSVYHNGGQGVTSTVSPTSSTTETSTEPPTVTPTKPRTIRPTQRTAMPSGKPPGPTGPVQTTTSTKPTTPLPVPEMPEFVVSYIGCFQDGRGDSDRTMTYVYTSDSMSIEACLDTCIRRGQPFAGLQNGKECWCSVDDGFERYGRLEESRCNTCCGGHVVCDQWCGSGWVNSVYALAIGPEVQADFEYIGCFKDGMNSRSRTMTLVDTSNEMTVTRCVDTCARWGHLYAGLQYETQCWCSSDEDFASIGRLSDRRCNKCCRGDPVRRWCRHSCGSGWVNSVYSVLREVSPPHGLLE